MIKRLPYLLLLALLCVAVLGVSVSARVWYDKAKGDRVLDGRASTLMQYAFPGVEQERVARVVADDLQQPPAVGSAVVGPVSLGSAGPSAVESPGITVRNSYDDWQWTPKGIHVDYGLPPNGLPSVHFGYTELASGLETGVQGYGYNVYDPVAADWPRGIDVGCRVQAGDLSGYRPTLGLEPNGRVVLAGNSMAAGFVDHHVYRNLTPHACFWGTGSQIPASQYTVGMGDSTSTLVSPVVAVQLFGEDTIIHIVASEQNYYYPDSAAAPDVAQVVLQYFRLVNETDQPSGATSWQGPITIDSAAYVPTLAASKTGAKVAVGYNHQTAWAFTHNNRWDSDVYYRESTDGGATWGSPQNTTNYNRTEASYSPWIEVLAFYDSGDDLHLLWNANPFPENVYDVQGFFFGDFTCSLWHWTTRTGERTRVANRDYGIQWNTRVCGMGGANTLYLAFFNMAECNNRLYVTYCGWNDIWADPPIIDDCASSFNSAPNRVYQANGEIYLHVSTSLDGLLWDAARNLTNSRTPGCDSAAGGGICMNDTKVMLAPYAMDVTGYGSTLEWPALAELVVDTSWTGNSYVSMFYVEDRLPGNFAIGRGDPTNNPLKWVRFGCVEPVPAPAIVFSPDVIGYPVYVQHGDADTITVQVTNDGNEELHVTTIGTHEESPVSGWLTVSQTDLTVGAGVYNTGTYDVYINQNGNIDAPGTIVSLNGEVYMLSDAPEPRDSVSFFIDNYIIADTIIGMEWDTVATGLVSLVVSNMSEMGSNGQGEVNLDYVANGGECNANANVYLYSGGPLLLRKNAAQNYTFNCAMHQAGFATDRSYKRVWDGLSSTHISGSNYDGSFTGTAVNYDSTIAIERTYYAPTGGADSADFVIMKTDIFSWDDNPHSNLIVGEVLDWDIWGDQAAFNTCGILDTVVNGTDTLLLFPTVYIQGMDTAGDTGCQPDSNRFGCGMMLGYHTSAEYETDNCANHYMPHGAWASTFHDWWDDATFSDSVAPNYQDVWDSLKANSALNINDTLDDQAQFIIYVYDYSLAATDTLTIYSVATSVHNGSLAELKVNLEAAKAWYLLNLRSTCDSTVETFYPDSLVFGCCMPPSRGNVDYDAGGVIDIGDVTALIDFLYIRPGVVPPECPEEADVNTDEVTDIGDVTRLIDFLYIRPGVEPLDPC